MPETFVRPRQHASGFAERKAISSKCKQNLISGSIWLIVVCWVKSVTVLEFVFKGRCAGGIPETDSACEEGSQERCFRQGNQSSDWTWVRLESVRHSRSPDMDSIRKTNACCQLLHNRHPRLSITRFCSTN